MADYPYIRLDGVPNDIYLATACVIGLFIAAVAIRLSWSFADNPRLWNDVETARAMYGLYILRIVSVFSLIVTLFLLARVEYTMTKVWYHQESFNKQYWNIWRVVAACVLPVCSGLFHTHTFFRFYCAVAFPGLALLDMLSELDLAGWYYCMTEGTCVSTTGMDAAYLWMWRDLTAIAINICGTATAWFMWGQFGFCKNEIYVPRTEHRVLTNELNRMQLGRRNVKRRLGDEDFVEW